jgi:hypothetical protein
MALAVVAGLWAIGAENDHARPPQALPSSKLTLSEGIQQAVRLPEIAISAKYEFDNAGKLSLSIYTAQKGFAADAEHNVFRELSGNPEVDKWKPNEDILKDIPRVASASSQFTLLSLTNLSLLDILKKAETDQSGTVFSITPVVQDRKGQFLVLVSVMNKTVELRYDLMTGELLLPMKK